MKTVLCAIAIMTAASGRAFAGHNADSTIWVTNVEDAIDSGWMPHLPSSSSDYFNVAHEVVPGLGDTEEVADGLPASAMSVSVADFGSGRTFAIVGVFAANLGLDASGKTPDLAFPITYVKSPPLSPPPLYQYVPFELAEAIIPAGSTTVHAVVQMPPADSGLLGLGADSTSKHPGVGTSGFTTDGYASPALIGTFFDFGLNVGQDNSATTSCKPKERKPHGRLRASNLRQGVSEGDHLTATIKAGDTVDLAFFGTKPGDQVRVYCTTAPCTPLAAIGPVLTTLVDGDGDGSYLRINAAWPFGYGGQTIQFSALWGNAACAMPGVGFTNCVTIISTPDPTFGNCDDGTIESGWVVQIPSGSSDYFNNNFGNGSSANGVVGLTLAVLDFGTAVPAYPTSGVSNANLGVDGTGNTPDIGSALATVSPFTFPSLTFATTSGAYITHAVSIPSGSLGTNVHGWVQFPPGDSGLLGVGGDTTAANGCSYFSLDGYNSPAISFFANWGIRIKTN